MTEIVKRRSLFKEKSQGDGFASEYDYVLVFPMDGTKQTPAAKFVITALQHAGLEVFSYLSIQEDELITLVRCPVGYFYFRSLLTGN